MWIDIDNIEKKSDHCDVPNSIYIYYTHPKYSPIIHHMFQSLLEQFILSISSVICCIFPIIHDVSVQIIQSPTKWYMFQWKQQMVCANVSNIHDAQCVIWKMDQTTTMW